MAMPPMVGVPALVMWPCGPSSRIGWPMWRRVEHADQELGADERHGRGRRRRRRAGGSRARLRRAGATPRPTTTRSSNGVTTPPMSWVRLVALAGDQHDVTGRGRGRGPGAMAARRSGSTTEVGRLGGGWAWSNPCLTASMMAPRVLAPRIVGGQDHHDRPARRPPRPSPAAWSASRSPPQPNTTTTRPWRRSARSSPGHPRPARSCSSPSGVWA